MTGCFPVYSPTRYLRTNLSALQSVFIDDSDMIKIDSHLPPIGDSVPSVWSLLCVCSSTLSDKSHVHWEYHIEAYD